MTDTAVEREVTTIVTGQRYRVNIDNPEGAEVPIGTTVQCSVGPETGRTPRFQVVTDQDVAEGHEWIIYPIHLDPLPTTVTIEEAFVPATVTQEEHDRVVAALNARIAEIELTHRADRDRAANFQRQAHTDADTISSVLIDEATSRDWCGDYDAIISRINGRLSVLSLNEREVDYDVTWQETYTVTITRSGSFTGIRDDSDGNSERAEEVRDNSEALSEYELIQALRDNGSHEFEEYVDDSLEWGQS